MSEHAPALPAPGAGADAEAARRAELALWILTGLAIIAILAAAAAGLDFTRVMLVLVLGLIVISYQRTLLAWPTLLGLIIVVILFIPIRRYTIAGSLPIELEPYRIVIAVVLGCWFCALAADPDVEWRKTGFEWPILTLAGAILASLTLNVGKVAAVSDIVVKQVSFFVSYLLVMYLIASVVRRGRQLDLMLRLLVGGGVLLAISSLVEWRTGVNHFNWFGQVIPGLTYVDLGEHINRGTGVRAMTSAQHPIALGAALVMLVPLTVYLYRRDGHFGWMVGGALLTLGALATGSRTVAIMLIALLVSILVIKPKETVRLLPYLLPLTIVIQGLMPGTLGTFRATLQPSYVIREQSIESGTGSGRIADLGPALQEWAHSPFVGAGFGTRISSQEGVAGGAQILDDQWLGMLLTTGALGVLGLLWLFCRAIRRLTRLARADTTDGPDGWLAASLAASITSFAVGMITFDAFAFIQVTFFSFIVLGFAAVATEGRDLGPPAGHGRPAAS